MPEAGESEDFYEFDFEPARVLADAEEAIGDPPRDPMNVRQIGFLRDRPEWLTEEDLTRRIYEEYDWILSRGLVRWAAVIHANNSMFYPADAVHGSQVVYDASGQASLETLLDVAGRCMGLKQGTGATPEERRIGDMLADELERALDWPLPATINEGHGLYTTIVMLPRPNIPQRVLACSYFPVVADPETRMAVLVPSRIWSTPFRKHWNDAATARLEGLHQQADAWRDMLEERERRKAKPKVNRWFGSLSKSAMRIAREREETEDEGEEVVPVRLTTQAVNQLRDILKQSGNGNRSVRIRIHPGRLSLEHDDELAQGRVRYSVQDLPLLITYEDLPHLIGFTIDYRKQEGLAGFAFDSE